MLQVFYLSIAKLYANVVFIVTLYMYVASICSKYFVTFFGKRERNKKNISKLKTYMDCEATHLNLVSESIRNRVLMGMKYPSLFKCLLKARP